MNSAMATDTDDVPLPLPSQHTPRTSLKLHLAEIVERKSRRKNLLSRAKRNAEILISALAATGWTVAQIVDNTVSLVKWARSQGLYPAMIMLAIGLAMVFVRRTLTGMGRLEDSFLSMARQWESDRAETRARDEAHEERLRRLEDATGPFALQRKQD